MSQYFLFSSKCYVMRCLVLENRSCGLSKGSFPPYGSLQKENLRNIITCRLSPSYWASFEVETYTKEASQSLIKSYKVMSTLYVASCIIKETTGEKPA